MYGLVNSSNSHQLTAVLVYIHHRMYHALCFREQESANRMKPRLVCYHDRYGGSFPQRPRALTNKRDFCRPISRCIVYQRS